MTEKQAFGTLESRTDAAAGTREALSILSHGKDTLCLCFQYEKFSC